MVFGDSIFLIGRRYKECEESVEDNRDHEEPAITWHGVCYSWTAIDLEPFTTSCIYIANQRKISRFICNTSYFWRTIRKLTAKQSCTVYQSFHSRDHFLLFHVKTERMRLKIRLPVLILPLFHCKDMKEFGTSAQGSLALLYFFSSSVLYKICTSLHFYIYREVAARTFIRQCIQ